MRDFVLQNLVSTEGLDFTVLLLNNLVAMAVAFFIMGVYKLTYNGAAYSRKFNVSTGMIVMITTSIMCVISNNVALSLGMVGALSIIRFRTAVKDVRDSAYIFWAIAAGIGCGVSQYMLVIIGSVFLCVFLLLTRQIKPDNRRMLVVRCGMECQEAVESAVKNIFSGAAHQVVKSASGTDCELIYGVSAGQMKRAGQRGHEDVIQELMGIAGVNSANLIEQTDDIGR